MPKNIVLESIKHHLYRALERSTEGANDRSHPTWRHFYETVSVSLEKDGQVKISWVKPEPKTLSFDRDKFVLYRRGDMTSAPMADDPKVINQKTADDIVSNIRQELGLKTESSLNDLLQREQTFHDKWASDTSVDNVMVVESFEACTAPEHRCIMGFLGDISGKKILDMGCGLGEAAVYFAMKGANVTASDLSSGMVEMAKSVGRRFGVTLHGHVSSADQTGLPDNSFDIVYAGNILHHADIPKVLDEAKRILKPGGVFVSWDPLIHNPAINVYRKLAMAVRTIDEHPLHMKELRYFRERFSETKFRFFWLTTLLVFLRFFFWERVHPGKERYWKKILTDAQRLKSFYSPLEKFDAFLLKIAPWLGRYCWNVVVWCRK